MQLRASKSLPPRPEEGLRVAIWPPNDLTDTECSLRTKRRCEVLEECCGIVRVRWLDGVDQIADIPLEWWQGAAFTSRPVPQFDPSCELCGARFTEAFCRGLAKDIRAASACLSCRALSLCANGLQREAEVEMNMALQIMAPRPEDLGYMDALRRHWSSVRTALGFLDKFGCPAPMNLADVEALQDVDISSLASFTETWRRWLELYFARQDVRTVCLRRITLEMTKAKRVYGDGSQLDEARRLAEGSLAWRRRLELQKSRESCEHGMRIVRKNAEKGILTHERMTSIVCDKEVKLQQLDKAILSHEESFEYQKVLLAFADYTKWLYGSGIADLQEERQNIGFCPPTLEGHFLEAVAVRWLESESRPSLAPGLHYRVLQNVCFRGVAMPAKVASEFDAMVVVCRLCDDLSPPPAQAGPREGLWQVTSLYRWVEVKSDPAEILEAWLRHRDARCALAAWTGFIGVDHGNTGRYWFPQSVFAEFDNGVTFFTMPGFASICRGSQVPSSLLMPSHLILRLFQFALDSLSPQVAMDADDPMSHWDYVEELYLRSGELFMPEGGNPEDYRGYLQNAVVQLREFVDKGQVFVAADPFCSCYQVAAQLARTEDGLELDELAQSILYYLRAI